MGQDSKIQCKHATAFLLTRIVRLPVGGKQVKITYLQLGFLQELLGGPACWFCDHPEARALTKRGLARYERGWRDWHYAITDKGRQAIKSATDEQLTEARRAAEYYDASIDKRSQP